MRADRDGQPVFAQRFGGRDVECGLSVDETPDGGYVAIGGRSPDGDGRNVYLVKTDADGDLAWERRLGVDAISTSGRSVKRTPDGGYVVAGSTWRDSGPGIYLGRTGPDGVAVWETVLEGEYASDVEPTRDGGFAVSGTLVDGANRRGLLVKTDASGDVVWTAIYPEQTYAISVEEMPGGEGFVVAGGAESSDFADPARPADTSKIVLLKTDAGGEVVWTRRFGRGTYTRAMQTTEDGGIIVAGNTLLLGRTGPQPVDPFPTCGPGDLPTDEMLGCATPPKCP